MTFSSVPLTGCLNQWSISRITQLQRILISIIFISQFLFVFILCVWFHRVICESECVCWLDCGEEIIFIPFLEWSELSWFSCEYIDSMEILFFIKFSCDRFDSLSLDSVIECGSVLVNVSVQNNREKERIFEFTPNRSLWHRISIIIHSIDLDKFEELLHWVLADSLLIHRHIETNKQWQSELGPHSENTPKSESTAAVTSCAPSKWIWAQIWIDRLSADTLSPSKWHRSPWQIERDDIASMDWDCIFERGIIAKWKWWFLSVQSTWTLCIDCDG